MTGRIDKQLQVEVHNLIHYIDRLRREIAGIAQGKADQTRFESMADRLDAIISSTADATEKILTAMEGIDADVAELRASTADPATVTLCAAITDKTTVAMEACSFQDLTGQRVSKVIGSLRFVEDRVSRMADLCGRDEVARIGADLPDPDDDEDDGVALEGPQRPDAAISQDDIDRLFA